MAAKIFLWVGHPRESSLSHGMADAYQRGAKNKALKYGACISMTCSSTQTLRTAITNVKITNPV